MSVRTVLKRTPCLFPRMPLLFDLHPWNVKILPYSWDLSLLLSIFLYYSKCPRFGLWEPLSLNTFPSFFKDFFSILVQNLWDSLCIFLASASEPAVSRALFHSWRAALDSRMPVVVGWVEVVSSHLFMYVLQCRRSNSGSRACQRSPVPLSYPDSLGLFHGLVSC